MTVEGAVVSHIVHHGEESLIAVIDAGITAEYFTEDRTSAAIKWLMNQWSEHRQVPSSEMFGRRFPNFKLIFGGDPIGALIDELRNHYAQAVAVDLIPGIVTELTKEKRRGDTFELPKVLGMIGELQQRISVIRSVNDVALLTEKTSSYVVELFAMKGVEVPGIPTGFDTLDIASGGWMPENFGVIGAGPKRFKTAILVWMALAAARAGYLAKVVTFEMSIKELMDRIFCLGAQVNYTNVLRGNLNDKERKRISNFEAEQGKWEGDIEIVHDITAVTSVSGLTSQIRSSQRRPDIVFIDGIYQMVDDTREWTSEAMALTAVSRSIKRMAAAEQLPVVGTTQALLSRLKGRNGMQMGSLGYTSAFAQDANVILGLDRPDMNTNSVLVEVVGARTMAGMTIEVVVDLATGTIFEAGEVTDSNDDFGHD